MPETDETPADLAAERLGRLFTAESQQPAIDAAVDDDLRLVLSDRKRLTRRLRQRRLGLGGDEPVRLRRENTDLRGVIERVERCREAMRQVVEMSTDHVQRVAWMNAESLLGDALAGTGSFSRQDITTELFKEH
jgi:hypothetical protein